MPEKKDFIGLFTAETEDHLAALNKMLVEFEKNSDKLDIIKELNRRAHTLKGSARIFGFQKMETIAHKIEDIFECITQGNLHFSKKIATTLFSSFDLLKDILDSLSHDGSSTIDIQEICTRLE